jgi:hypothetical protein
LDFRHHFRADAVAGEEEELLGRHGSILFRSKGNRKGKRDTVV